MASNLFGLVLLLIYCSATSYGYPNGYRQAHSVQQRYQSKCGWLGWGLCTRYRTVTNYYLKCYSHARLDGQSCRVDCSVNNWGGWSGCTQSCNQGTKARYRTVLRHASNGGHGCPSLSETTVCNRGHQACNIGHRCYHNGYKPSSCQVCNIHYSKTSWQDISGGCHDSNQCTKHDRCINGRCTGTPFSCPWCSTCNGHGGCNPKHRLCLISNQCYRHGQRNPSSPSCQECNTDHSQTAWHLVSGRSCNDGNLCTKDDKCTNGRCTGTGFSCPKTCTQCNGNGGCDPKPNFCLIFNHCYNQGHINPSSPHCQLCNHGANSRQWSNRPVGTRCSNPDVCIRNSKCNSNGQCVGEDYRHECQTECQRCSSSGKCQQTKGCIASNRRCGCSIGGRCYAERQTNPSTQCQYCKLQENPSAWTNKENGFNCNDNNICTHTDRCVGGRCSGTAYQCSVRKEDVCMRSNNCNGKGGCLPSFFGSEKRCYERQDACDHPTTYCTGRYAVCSVTTIKQLPGGVPPISLGTVTLTDHQQTVLPKSTTKEGEEIALTKDTGRVTIKLEGFTVPCGNVQYTTEVRAYPNTGSSQLGSVRTTGNSGDALTVSIPVAMQHGSMYRVHVRAANIRSNTVSMTSLPLLVDTSAPTLTDGLQDGPLSVSVQFNKDIDYQSSLSALTVNWKTDNLQDAESGISRSSIKMSYGTSPTSAQHPFVDCPSSQRDSGYCMLEGLQLQRGVRYYAFLSVDNVLGTSGIFSTDGVTLDDTPPTGGMLNLMGLLPAQADNYEYISSADGKRLTATLSGVSDPESGLIKFSQVVCDQGTNLCTEQGYTTFSCTSQPCTVQVDHPNDRLVSQGSFLNNHVYSLVARVENNAGLTSDIQSERVLVDRVPPTGGAVFDGSTTGVDIMYQSNTDQLSANWNGFVDSESGIKNYVVSVVDESDTTLATKTTTGLSLTIQTRLTHGVTYRMCVDATDNGDNSNRVCSNGLLIDSMLPVGGTVLDIDPSGSSLAEIDFQISTKSMKTKWMGFQALSGIQSYSWSIGTTAGSSDVLSKRAVGLQAMQSTGNRNLQSGRTYFANVWCTSRSGLTSLVSSDGVLVDTSPPDGGMVIDLCTDTEPCESSNDIDYTSVNDKLRARWFGFTDEQSGVKHYSWNYADCSSKVSLFGTDKPASLNTEFNSFPKGALDTNVRYCIVVRAMNNAGLISSIWSDGFLVDITAPRVFTVTDGAVVGSDTDHQKDVTAMHAVWDSPVDKQSAVLYQTIIAKQSSRTPALAISSMIRLPNTTTSYVINDLQLTDLETYIIEVCAVNYAGLERCAASDGVLIDVTAPTKGLVFTGTTTKGKRYQASNSSLTARWHSFIDRQSDIASFSWSVESAKDGSVVRAKENVGFRMEATANNMQLNSGEQYVVVVEAENNAGGVVMSESEAITIDTTPAVNAKKPVLQFNGNTASVSWEPFKDDESFVWYYKWAIGVEPFGNQITGYNMAGNLSNMAEMQSTFVTGQVYYATVIGRNRAGLWTYENHCSLSVVFDGSPPVLRDLDIVDSTLGIKVTIASSTSDLSCNWALPVDHESMVTDCAVNVLGESENTILHSSGVSPEQVSYAIPHSALAGASDQIQCQLQCSNLAGLSSSTMSATVILDNMPPSPGSANVPDFWAKPNQFTLSWTPCTDSESVITEYKWWLVNTATDEKIGMKTESGIAQRSEIDGVQFEHGQTYAVYMQCSNSAGLETNWTSPTFLVDLTQPSVSSVSAAIQPAASESMTGSNPNMHLSAKWRASRDNESGVLGYRWAVGVSPGGCQVANFSLLSLDQEMLCDRCVLVQGETYFVTVETTNKAGGKAKSTSFPVTVDISAPEVGLVEVENIDLDDGCVTARCFSFQDHQSSIKSCEWILWSGKVILAQSRLPCTCFNCTFNTLPIFATHAELRHIIPAALLQVVCTNVANKSTTREVIVDFSSPSMAHLSCKPFVVNASEVMLHWKGFYDQQSPGLHFQWTVSDASLSSNTSPVWRTDGIHLEYSRVSATQLSIRTGVQYTATVQATNIQGLFVRSSCTFHVDSTHPEKGNVQLATGHSFISNVDSLLIEWSGFQDDESGIMRYEWCLSTPGQQSSRIFCKTVGSEMTTAHCRDCPVVSGVAYTVQVTATNAAGLITMATSNAVTLDRSPPIVGAVYEGMRGGDDIDYIKSTSMLNLQRLGFADAESGISRCDFELRTSQGDNKVWSATVLDPQTSVSLNADMLPTGQKLITHVTCWNQAGLTSFNVSDGVVVDSSRISLSSIRLQVDYESGVQPEVQVWLDGVEDSESGVETISAFLIDVSTTEPVYSVNQMDFSSYFAISGANLTQGGQYFIRVTLRDRSGWRTTAESDQFIFDSTAPSEGSVNDGIGLDIDYTSHVSSLSANWASITDSESGISHFDYAIGTTPGGTQTLSYTNVGTSTSATCPNTQCQIKPGVKYYATVRATNGANLKSWFISDGVTVDTTPPLNTALSINSTTSGNNTIRTAQFISTDQVLQVSWGNSTVDYESPIIAYSLCLSEVEDTCSLGPAESVGMVTKASLTVPQLSSNTAVYVVVMAENAALLTGTVTSWKLIIDNTPPRPGVVVDGETNDDLDCQLYDQPVSASWHGFEDRQSGIAIYHWAIGSQPFTADIQDWTNVGSQTSGTVVLNNTRPGQVLYSSIRAFNKAQIPTQAASDGMRLQSTAQNNIAEFCMAP
eukprot:scpid2836/ scgid1491/ 